MNNKDYGDRIKHFRIKMGLTQNQVAQELSVTPGYVSNVENGRTAMSLRMLMYYAKLTGQTIDSMVGELEPEYKESSIDKAIFHKISKLDTDKKKKLLATLEIWSH